MLAYLSELQRAVLRLPPRFIPTPRATLYPNQHLHILTELSVVLGERSYLLPYGLTTFAQPTTVYFWTRPIPHCWQVLRRDFSTYFLCLNGELLVYSAFTNQLSMVPIPVRLLAESAQYFLLFDHSGRYWLREWTFTHGPFIQAPTLTLPEEFYREGNSWIFRGVGGASWVLPH